MPRHPTARRVRRPPPAPDDVFVERVLGTTAWASTHRRAIIVGSVSLLVIVVGFLYYRNYRATLNERAGTELAQLRQTVQSGNSALAIRDAEQFIERFGSTPSAPEARLMLAEAYLASGQFQQAIETIDAQASDLDEPMGPPAAFLLATAHEVGNQLDDAEEVYLRIAQDAPYEYQRENALDAAARVRLERGDAQGAVELYDRLLETLSEDSPDRIIYEMRRAEARALAGAAPPS